MSSPTSSTHRPTVYLHLGEPKCGTTYLQEIVWRNRDVLRAQGLELPGMRQGDVWRASQDLREVAPSKGDPSGPWLGEWTALARAAVHTPHAMLISQEHLCGASADQASRAIQSLSGTDVHVIVTVRDFASLLPAEWQETVKHRNGRTWEGWLSDILETEGQDITQPRAKWFWRAHDTVDILRRWASTLPLDHVHVIPIPSTRTQPTLLWERFAGVIGVDPGSVVTDTARANATLGIVETEMLRLLNLRLPKEVPHWFYAQEVKGHVAHRLLAERPASTRPQLPKKYLGWATERSDRIVKELAASGYDIVGDLDDLRPKAGESDAPEQIKQPSDAELLDAALDTLAKLVRDQHRRRVLPRARKRKGMGGVLESPRVRRLARRIGTRYPAAARAGEWTLSLVERANRGKGK